MLSRLLMHQELNRNTSQVREQEVCSTLKKNLKTVPYQYRVNVFGVKVFIFLDSQIITVCQHRHSRTF